MLAFSFFAAIFSSLLWLIYMLAYIGDNTVGVKFSSLGMTDFSVYVALILFPIIVIWAVFGYINQYLNTKNLNQNLFQLFKQMKKNQDYTDLIARIMLESEQQIKDGFILNRIDILIADMNELIAELISRASLASFEQIENLWGKVRNGGKWALGKVIIEVSQNQPNFEMRIMEKSQRDLVLAGTILEFCARYQNILSLLDKHDKERVFLNVIETGVFGKVYSILAPLSDEIRRQREVSFSANNNRQDIESPEPKQSYTRVSPSYKPIVDERKNPILSGISKLGSLLKKEKATSQCEVVSAAERDPFSIALERSFGSNDEPELQAAEPKFEFSEPDAAEPHFDEPRLMPSFAEEAPEIFLNEENKETPKDEIIIGSPDDNAKIPPLIISRDNSDEIDSTASREEELPQAVETATQKTLNDLRKEWEDMRKVSHEEATVDKKEENFTYPFGGWTDESNYNK